MKKKKTKKMNKLVAALLVFGVLVLYPLTAWTKSSNETASLVLSKNNTIVLNQEVTPQSVAEVIMAAKELDNSFSRRPLHLVLYTPGGSIQDGLELIEALKGLHRPVDTAVIFAASMGWQIAQGLGERNITKSGVLMSHRAAGEFEGSFGGQYPSQVDSRFNLWLQRLKEMDEITVSRTNGKQTLKSYQKAYDNELWLTGTQAVEQGYADKVVNISCDHTLDGTKNHVIDYMGVKISYDTANCPLITALMNVKIQTPMEKKDAKEIEAQAEKNEEIKAKFLAQYQITKNKFVPMRW